MTPLTTITRRQAILTATAAGILAASKSQSRLSFGGYIWINYAAREKKPIAELLDELFATAPYGGFTNIELSDPYFAPALRERVLALTRQNGLSMPSVYVGGVMHERELADQTIARALEIGALCKQFGCKAVVHNPGSKAKGRKTDEDLASQAQSLNRMGAALQERGLQLRIHHHTTEMEEGAREWHNILKNTDPLLVTACLDVELVHKGGIAPIDMVRETGARITELHLRNKRGLTPLESFDDGDIDYIEVASVLRELKIQPLLMIELAYHSDTVVTRSLKEDMRLSRIYAEKTFQL